MSRRANSKCHSAAAPRDGSQSVGTLTRNQRKLDFNCREYKVPLSRPRCLLLLLFFFSFFLPLPCSYQNPPTNTTLCPPCPCVPGGLIRIACVQNIAGGFPLCFSAAEAFVRGTALRSLLYLLLWGNYDCGLSCPLNLWGLLWQQKQEMAPCPVDVSFFVVVEMGRLLS